MWVVTIFSGLFLIVMANNYYFERPQKEIPWNATETTKDLSRFQTFATAAELYMRDNKTLAIGTSVSVAQVMANAKGLPSAFASADFSGVPYSSWKIRVIDKGLGNYNYVLCTSMSMGSISQLAQLPQNPLWNPKISWLQRNSAAIDATSTTVSMVIFDDSSIDARDCL